jgi:hypothetical protein
MEVPDAVVFIFHYFAAELVRSVNQASLLQSVMYKFPPAARSHRGPRRKLYLLICVHHYPLAPPPNSNSPKAFRLPVFQCISLIPSTNITHTLPGKMQEASKHPPVRPNDHPTPQKSDQTPHSPNKRRKNNSQNRPNQTQSQARTSRYPVLNPNIPSFKEWNFGPTTHHHSHTNPHTHMQEPPTLYDPSPLNRDVPARAAEWNRTMDVMHDVFDRGSWGFRIEYSRMLDVGFGVMR